MLGGSEDRVEGSSRGGWVALPSSLRLVASWLALGLANNAGYVVMLSSAESLLAGHAGAVLAADIVPTFLAKSIAPLFADRLAYWVRYVVCTVSMVAGYLLVAFGDSIGVRLGGVCLTSLASGLGEATSLAFTGQYGILSVTAWSSGTGLAGIFGAGWVLAFHSLHASTPLTIASANFFSVLYLLSWLFFLPTPSHPPQRESGRGEEGGVEGGEGATGGEGEGGSGSGGGKVGLLCGEEGREGEGVGIVVEEEEGGLVVGGDEESGEEDEVLGLWPKLTIALPRLWRPMLALFTVYTAEYVMSTGVNSVLSFPDSHKHTFYIQASFAYQTGVFLSRSFAARLPFPSSLLWPFPVLQLITLTIAIVQALTDFIPFAWIMLCLVFWEGLLGGATYVRAFSHIRATEPPKFREFSLGIASVADTCGILLASLISLATEPALNTYREQHGLRVD